MSALDRMQDRILQDARARADEIVSAASAEAEEMLGRAKALAAKRREEELARAAEEDEEMRRRVLTLAQLEARKQVLATKAALIEEVFRDAARRLVSLEPATYKAYLKREMLAAARSEASGVAQVFMSPRDRDTLGPEVVAEANSELAEGGRKARLELSDDGGEFDGGFMLKSGNIETNCTFDAILAKEREALLAEVAGVLFG